MKRKCKYCFKELNQREDESAQNYRDRITCGNKYAPCGWRWRKKKKIGFHHPFSLKRTYKNKRYGVTL